MNRIRISASKQRNPKSPKRRVPRLASRNTKARSVSQTEGGDKHRLRREFREWRASLPTALERDTLLMPDVIAETVVQEAERFLKAGLPADYPQRLAARAHYLYPRHRHFHQGLNRPGNRGRENLYMFMRHWTAGWLRRERNPLHKKLPWSFGMGQRLPD